jgi:hypothetical protein
MRVSSKSFHTNAGVALCLLFLVKVRADDPVDILGAFDGVGPFICALFFLIFVLHLLVQPSYALMHLMQAYLNEGTTIPGTVLDCEPRNVTNDSWLVEVMWECEEHKVN